MINELQTSKSCYFFKQRTRVTSKAITELFRAVRSSQVAASNNHFSFIREVSGAANWSGLCFQFERTPPFLPGTQTLVDRVTGYILLIEYRGHIAVFKSQIDVTPEFSKRYLQRMDPQAVDRGLTSKDSIFDRVRLRHMSLSRFALRSKTLEGENLQNNVGMSSSSRFAPLGYSFQESGEHFSTTPRTGRISQRADKAGYVDLLNYACDIIDRIHPKPGRPSSSPFLAAFSRPMDLIDLTAAPSQFAVDTAILRQALSDEKAIRLIEVNGANLRELQQNEVNQILIDLTAISPISPSASARKKIINPNTGAELGEISLNKSRIALKRLELPSISNIYVESTQFSVGMDGDRIKLKQFIDKEDIFIILFDQPQFAYLDGNLYRDESLTNGGDLFLAYLFGKKELSQVVDEKGKFTTAHIAFDNDSTFGVIPSAIAPDDDVLVCDDLGDEWADFIGLRTDPSAPRITFYHAKHGALSLGASPFHVSVGQAIKNLGNLSLPVAAMSKKYMRWSRSYTNNRVRTNISRTCRGTAAAVQQAVDLCRNAPHTTKRVAIVTSSLSKSAVQQAFNDIAAGAPVDPYFVQLYWLLSSFFAACTEVGAFGCVICQE